MKCLIFGGAGSLGKTLVKRLFEEEDYFKSNEVIVFSRDEAKHHNLKIENPKTKFVVGDIRSKESIKKALQMYRPNCVINCAAIKQIGVGEDFPLETVMTNIIGTQNIIDVIFELKLKTKFLFISTDKACEPISSYGCTKFLGERIVLNAAKQANEYQSFMTCRYGNVLESTGSVIPLFKNKLEKNEKLPITHPEMTRFLLSLNDAVNLIFNVLMHGRNGSIYVPKMKSSKIIDIAKIMLEENHRNPDDIEVVGIRQGEKLHEKLISDDESTHVYQTFDKTFPLEITPSNQVQSNYANYSSDNTLMSYEETKQFLKSKNVI